MQPYSQTNLRLQIYGYRRLTHDELTRVFDSIKREVELGLEKRVDGSADLTGILAIPTKCTFINYSDWEKVKSGAYVIVCNYGGTRWITGIRRKMNDGFEKIGTDSVISFPVDKRSYTFDGFIELMKTEILKLDPRALKLVDTIGLSLGFPQRPEWTNYGLDARIIPKVMSKSWEISNMKNLPYSGLIGEELLCKLNALLPGIKSVYIRNDAEAIGSDVTRHSLKYLPLTLVMGTGINMVVTRKRDKQNVNLEIGKAKLDIDTFSAVEYMHMNNDVDCGTNILEYHTGGDCVRSKVHHGLKNLAFLKNSEKVLKLFEGSAQEDIVSKFARKEDLGLDPFDAEVAEIVSTAALTQAGQLGGCAFAAVAIGAGYERDCIESCAVLTDGSMLHKAHLVKQEFLNTVNEFLKTDKILIMEPNGMDGIAKFALTKHYAS